MTRKVLTQDMGRLQQDLVKLGAAVERQIQRSVEALEQRDVAEAERIAAQDSEVDRMRYLLEESCMELLATQGPVASDLRTVAAVLIIANELERIGDYAEGICRLTIKMAGEPPVKPLIDIPRMSAIAQHMLQTAMQAFVARDASLAEQAWEQDDELDQLYQRVLHDLLRHMLGEPAIVTRATYLLWVAHNLERIGDRVGNIAERVIFMLTGFLDRHTVEG